MRTFLWARLSRAQAGRTIFGSGEPAETATSAPRRRPSPCSCCPHTARAWGRAGPTIRLNRFAPAPFANSGMRLLVWPPECHSMPGMRPCPFGVRRLPLRVGAGARQIAGLVVRRHDQQRLVPIAVFLTQVMTASTAWLKSICSSIMRPGKLSDRPVDRPAFDHDAETVGILIQHVQRRQRHLRQVRNVLVERTAKARPSIAGAPS